jgi:hypothetical protein
MKHKQEAAGTLYIITELKKTVERQEDELTAVKRDNKALRLQMKSFENVQEQLLTQLTLKLDELTSGHEVAMSESEQAFLSRMIESHHKIIAKIESQCAVKNEQYLDQVKSE